MNEFELIAHFFSERKQGMRDDVVLGIGDDCAVLTLPQDKHLLMSMDTLVQGVHFPETTQASDIGYKALAVNLSDLAAMGGTPAWFSLALTLPTVDKTWLHGFSEGLFGLAEEFNVHLVGGDTTRGPLSLTIQVHGFAPVGKAITRQGAGVGDLIYVTNNLGDAGLALKHIQGQLQLPIDRFVAVLAQLNRPYPRVKEGQLLAHYATAMIDLSDGLISDLGHILKQSKVGARVYVDKLPLSSALSHSLPFTEAVGLALSAGDDYELCFTIPAAKKEAVEALMLKAGGKITCIGEIISEPQLLLQKESEVFERGTLKGYSHFS
ncbi:thiamine-phosphate kinase [Legionella sp. km772]|uniref:thiamine-phosphate kinase n=1 Tax=Legionella sp. km772 TaxID=2498111 RepID=UPI000F8C4EFD|nr:thiamine-phosphate kinase [Legionella sp. km772]RUR11344.1 thiamine-phosphate kinase [Legionella sp. km772]